MKPWILLVSVAAFGLVTPLLHADDGDLNPSAPAVRKEVIAVIGDQLTAFRGHDLDRAYSFAAAALRQQFPPAQFAGVVRQGYPEIWANIRAEYGIVNDNGTRATVNVRVYTADTSAAYDYQLIHEAAGWRIGGVLRRAPKPADSA